MNKCEIIKDLLPLYEENLLSEESKTFVEDHLKTCPECKNLLKEDIEIENKNTKPLDFVEKRIKKETRQTVDKVDEKHNFVYFFYVINA